LKQACDTSFGQLFTGYQTTYKELKHPTYRAIPKRRMRYQTTYKELKQ